jgi:protein-S-isoprenylcysteine O-methyltransferase Ste14
MRIALALGSFFFRFRNAVFPIVFLAVVLFVPPARFLGHPAADLAVTTAAAVVLLLGQLIRCLTIGLVYIKRGGRNKRVYADQLVVEGIYAHTRNPMYVGNFMIAAGVCFMHGSPVVYLGVLAFFVVVYLSIVTAEERYLAGRFGPEYGEYCRSVNRFWPRLRGLRETLSQHTFDWKKVVEKEYGTVFSSLIAVYMVPLWKYFTLHGWEQGRGREAVLALPLVPVIVAYGVARYLKKSGRLRSEVAASNA